MQPGAPPFHPYLCLPAHSRKTLPPFGVKVGRSHRRYLSVALSVASRRPVVSRHSALRGPDFPPTTFVISGCLANFPGALYAPGGTAAHHRSNRPARCPPWHRECPAAVAAASRAARTPAIEQLRQTGVKFRQLFAHRQVQPGHLDLDEQRLAAKADEGRGEQRHGWHGRTRETGAVHQFLATLDEKLPPAMGTQRPPQFRRGAGHRRHRIRRTASARRAGRRVPCCPVAATAAGSGIVAPVERCLAARKGQPDQRVEQVVPVVGTRRHLRR
jgi:hypothetical protein